MISSWSIARSAFSALHIVAIFGASVSVSFDFLVSFIELLELACEKHLPILSSTLAILVSKVLALTLSQSWSMVIDLEEVFEVALLVKLAVELTLEVKLALALEVALL